MNYPILSTINSPVDLRSLNVKELPTLASELRSYIIDTLSTHPGHLASSLGSVELTVALHYVFNTPDDKLIWDVGHQSYAHKILTGRRDEFPTIRTYGGLSGFPRMEESPYDAFGTGHSSTSISAALGMATASKLLGNTSRQHVAIIGDGSMTGGEAFEALNNAGVSKANILVVLNDNGISIDKAVGGLSRHLTKMVASPSYNKLKDKVWNSLTSGSDDEDKNPRHVNFIQRMTSTAKTALLGGSNLFEALGFRYFGPIDGHNIEELVQMLSMMNNLKGPRLLHVVTKKGKGLRTAELNPVTYHAPGRFDSTTGQQIAVAAEACPPKYQDVFGHTLVELATRNDKIVGITPAMVTGCSMTYMMEKMPDRTFDVGIAEQHAVTFAAGLAAQGMRPFCNIYSSFMQRAYDQIIHDVALQRLPVVLCLDRAGLVGEDGATHHGFFDIACLRSIPNLTIAAPMDDHELRNLMLTAQLPEAGPFVIRYPRGKAVNVDWHNEMAPVAIGKGRILQEGSTVAILSLGHIGNDALKAAKEIEAQSGIRIGVYDMRFVKPLDTDLLTQIARGYKHIITLEDGMKHGGFGSAVAEYYCSTLQSSMPSITMLGIDDTFVAHGTVEQLHKDCKIDCQSIVDVALSLMKNH